MSPFFVQDFLLFTTTVAGILAFGLFYFALPYTSRRFRLSRELPGMKIGYLDLWGDAKNLQVNNASQKFPEYQNVCFLQVLSGYTQLFRSKMFFNLWFSFFPVVYIVKAHAVEQLISGTKHLQKSWTYSWLEPWLSTGLVTSHGQKWKSRRKLISPCFHFDILRDFLPVINEQAQFLVEKLRDEIKKDWTDITEPISLCTLDIICETTMGVNVNAQKDSDSEYVQATIRVSRVIMYRMSKPAYFFDWIFNLSSLGREFQKDLKLLHDFTRSVIRQKRAKLSKCRKPSLPVKRKALMDVLLEHQMNQSGSLTEEDIREEVDTFTFAGNDTTSMGVSWALYFIGLDQDVQSRLHDELDEIFGDDFDRPITEDDIRDMVYLDRVLKESQRIYPSVPMFGRSATDDTLINGHKIPEGTPCLVFTYGLHRDPEVFPDPEKFDPDRFLPENSALRHPYAYIPFSAGSRNCIGQRFAVLEEKVLIASILRNYTVESLEPRDKVMQAAELILRNAEPLKIQIRERR